MKEREYNNGEISVVWKAGLCIHAGICVKMLPEVYNPSERPWIKAGNATTEQLIHQVSRCPSGALSIKRNDEIIRIDTEDDKKKGRFALYENDILAGEITFSWAGTDKIILDHTGIEDEFRGKSYGKILVLDAVEFARRNNLKIIPLCPFVKSEFDKNSEISDVRF